MRATILKLSLLGMSITLATACGKDKEKKGGILKSSFEPSRIASGDLKRASLALSPQLGLDAVSNVVGQTEGTDLESLSYRVQGISLCGTLSTVGTGTSCSGGGEWTLYDGGRTSGDYDTYLPEQAAADTTHFTNFLDSESLKTLAGDLTYTDKNVQSYDSVLVYWYRPFKVKAAVTMVDDTTKVYTKGNGTFVSNGASGLNVTYENRVSTITTGPAEEGVFFLPNGGTYFRLQKKFEITDSDVNSKTNFKVVFAFDPDGLIKATSYDGASDPNGFLSGMADPTHKFRINAPFLQIAPVVAKEDETIMREIYLLRSKDADTPHDVRVSIYYVKEDPDQAVRAVTTTVVYNGLSTSAVGDLAQVESVESSGGALNFKDWTGLNVIRGLVRSSTPGQLAGEVVNESCNGSLTSDGCSGTTKSVTYSYSLVAASEVKAEITAGYIPAPATNP